MAAVLHPAHSAWRVLEGGCLTHCLTESPLMKMRMITDGECDMCDHGSHNLTTREACGAVGTSWISKAFHPPPQRSMGPLRPADQLEAGLQHSTAEHCVAWPEPGIGIVIVSHCAAG